MMMIKKMLKLSKIYFNPEIYYGKGAVSCLKNIQQDNILLFVSGTIKNSEYYAEILSYLDKKTYKEEIILHPTQEIVLALKEKYLNSKPEAIIAIGGGKVIDTAKVVKLILDNPNIDFSIMHKSQFSEKNEIKLVAIPTTPSTGSEANAVAVITNNKGFKTPYLYDSIIPNMAVLDTTFLEAFELNTLYTLAADIFTHASEGMVSIARTPLLKAIGGSCLSLLESAFKKLKDDPKDSRALSELSNAGYLGGILVGNAYVGAIHALAHTLEKQTGKSHSSLILSLIKPVFAWSKTQKNNPLYDEFLSIYENIGFEEYANRDILNNINVEEWIVDSGRDFNMMTNGIKMDKDNIPLLIEWVLNNK